MSFGEERQIVFNSAVRMHTIARENFRRRSGNSTVATPRLSFEFIQELNRIALEKAQSIQQGATRLKEGLQKLRQADIAVHDLKESLSEKNVHLNHKEAEANDALGRMSEEQRLTEKSKNDAEKLTIAAEEATEAAHVQQEELTMQLASVEPKVIAAREAVGPTRKENPEQLMGMPNPPSSVRAALESVMIVLNTATQKSIKSYTWGLIRSGIRDREFIASILNINSDLISTGLMHHLQGKIILTLLQLPLIEVGNAMRAYFYSTTSYP